MGKFKVKLNKKGADIVTARKSENKKSLNPFEVQVDREKFKVLGRVTNATKGRPGASRGKGLKKRKDTLGKEYSNKHKSNEFRDRRIGAGNNERSDDIATARFIVEKMAQYQSKKKSLYNLNDDEVLTHKGQTLEEIEQFNEVASDEDSEDEGKLNADFTELAHFGGLENEIEAQNRKSAIDELILESKKRKLEMLKEKEEIEAMTNKLDEKWKSLIPVMGKFTSGEREKPKPDEYDKTMREMIFEPRGEPSDRLISPEDLAKREREKLEKLENERLQRMRGDDDKPKFTHRSADDLDEGYCLNTEIQKPAEILAYDIENKENEEKEIESEEENEDEEEENSSGDDEEEKSEDDLNDLKDDGNSSNDEEVETVKNDVKESKISNMNGKHSNELPYTFEVPSAYDDFLNLVNPFPYQKQIIIIGRMIKSNHPRTSQEGKDKITTILTYILQFLNDMFIETTISSIKDNFKFLNLLSSMLFDLAKLLPQQITSLFKELIIEKQATFRTKKNKMPGIETLVFLKLISLIFPTSDYRHQVVTPTLIFISEILSNIRIKTRSDISRGIFLVCLVLEYTSISKRFLPSAVNFMRGIIFLCVKKRPVEIIPIIPPFKRTGPLSSLLTVTEDTQNKIKDEDLIMKSDDLVETETIDYEFKLRCLSIVSNLTYDVFSILSSHDGIVYYASDFHTLVEKLDLEIYPPTIQTHLEKLLNILSELKSKSLHPLVREKTRPKALRMIEPKFEKVYDGMKKFKGMTVEKEEKQKLLHKIKREKKGAIREIRRDNEFIAKINLKKQLQSDFERREKVKRIYSEASIQQGELNAFDRSKKKK